MPRENGISFPSADNGEGFDRKSGPKVRDAAAVLSRRALLGEATQPLMNSSDSENRCASNADTLFSTVSKKKVVLTSELDSELELICASLKWASDELGGSLPS
jgi:hypothetical protein